jgi:hypothetical protein
VAGREIEARGAGAGVYAPARLRSNLGWVRGGCERELGKDDGVEVAEREREPVGELQDDGVSHARGVVVAMEEVKTSEDDDEGAMPLADPQKRAYGSLRRLDPHRASRHARTQRVLRDGCVRWHDESEPQTLSTVKGMKAVVLDEPFACWTYHHLRQRHDGGLRWWFEWARPKDRDDSRVTCLLLC